MYYQNSTSTTTAGGGGGGGVVTPTNPNGPTIVPSVGSYIYYGCMTEATNGRALNSLENPVEGATLTVELCATACKGYTYFGTEYSGEWFEPRPLLSFTDSNYHVATAVTASLPAQFLRLEEVIQPRTDAL